MDSNNNAAVPTPHAGHSSHSQDAQHQHHHAPDGPLASSCPPPHAAAHSSQHQHHHHHHHDHEGQDDNDCLTSGEIKERNHLREVVLAFREYSQYAGKEIERRWSHLCQLPPAYASKLPPQSLGHAFGHQRAAVMANQAFLEVVSHGAEEFAPGGGLLEETAQFLEQNDGGNRIWTSQANRSKIYATLHSCFREWSVEGAAERQACFAPLVEELQRLLPVTAANRNRQRVLVPGAGVGRLPLEIVAKGYMCQGNEFSYQMLLASQFMLNCCETPKMFAIYPFLEQKCNLSKTGDNSWAVHVPDVCPQELLEQAAAAAAVAPGAATTTVDGEAKGEKAKEMEGKEPETDAVPPPDFSMTAGEFLQVYGGEQQRGCWNAVITCFFLDTAPVVIEYVSVIQRLLRPGGVWVNFGPLLYHWASGGGGAGAGGGDDERFRRSVELSWEEIRHVMVEGYGFEMQREEFRPSTYASNPRSMMWTQYSCLFFSAIKK